MRFTRLVLLEKIKLYSTNKGTLNVRLSSTRFYITVILIKIFNYDANLPNERKAQPLGRGDERN